MNATGRVQSKRHPNTIHFLYLHFVFTSVLVIICEILIQIVQISYNPACLVIRFNSRHHDITSIERYVGQSTIAFIYEVAYA